MTLLPLTDCCFLLGVDPKTLRLWLTSAQVACRPHPTDARLKCLTPPQLHHLAALHDRFLPDPLPQTVSGPLAPSLSPPDERVPHVAPEADVQHQLTLLHAQVATLQEHVTQLALAVVRQQQQQTERPAVTASRTVSTSPPAAATRRQPAPATSPASSKPSQPRSHVLALIEEGADGHFVIIAPDQGVLALLPDSPAWFAWLASLISFSFQSQQGSFSATRKFRDGQRIQSWNIHRSLHGRSCTLYLGLTPTLTIARLQEMASIAHARLTAL